MAWDAVRSKAVVLLLLTCFTVTPIVGVCNCFMFCCMLLYVHSTFAIILMGKRELVALLSFSFLCLLIVVWLYLVVPCVCLQFVIVVFADHNHLLFLLSTAKKYMKDRLVYKRNSGVVYDKLKARDFNSTCDFFPLFTLLFPITYFKINLLISLKEPSKEKALLNLHVTTKRILTLQSSCEIMHFFTIWHREIVGIPTGTDCAPLVADVQEVFHVY